MHRIFSVRSVAVMAACFSLAACVSVKMDGNLTVAAKQDKGVTRQQRGAVSGQRQLLGGWFNVLEPDANRLNRFAIKSIS